MKELAKLVRTVTITSLRQEEIDFDQDKVPKLVSVRNLVNWCTRVQDPLTTPPGSRDFLPGCCEYNL
jgi:hypothetical protein